MHGHHGDKDKGTWDRPAGLKDWPGGVGERRKEHVSGRRLVRRAAPVCNPSGPPWAESPTRFKGFGILLSLRRGLAPVAHFGDQTQKQGAGRVRHGGRVNSSRLCHQAGATASPRGCPRLRSHTECTSHGTERRVPHQPPTAHGQERGIGLSALTALGEGRHGAAQQRCCHVSPACRGLSHKGLQWWRPQGAEHKGGPGQGLSAQQLRADTNPDVGNTWTGAPRIGSYLFARTRPSQHGR